LLDTHIALWAVVDDPRLSARAAELIADPANEDADIEAVLPLQNRASLPGPFRYRSGDAPAPEIAQDFASGIVAGRACDAASRVASRAAQIEASDRTPIIRVTQHRTR
jgi:hypothetical protein